MVAMTHVTAAAGDGCGRCRESNMWCTRGGIQCLGCGRCRRLWHAGRGSGTVAGLIAMLVVFVMLGAASVMGTVAVAKATAGTAADEAVLAAAARLYEGSDAERACAIASAVAQRNGAAMRACSVQGEDAIVTVEANANGLAGAGHALPGVRIRAVARAGPIGCDMD